ncbi:MAG: hypothetical protein AAB518_00215 [Patescibacteria group bacterium]
MIQRITMFVRKLQNSPEATRRRWLIGLSGASAVLVVLLWVSYLDAIVEPTQAPRANIQEPGFVATFGKGVQVVIGEAKESGERFSGSVKEILGGTNEITFQKPPEDFILDSLPPVPRTPIP